MDRAASDSHTAASERHITSQIERPDSASSALVVISSGHLGVATKVVISMLAQIYNEQRILPSSLPQPIHNRAVTTHSKSLKAKTCFRSNGGAETPWKDHARKT